jgi:hypothetical protein
VPSPHRFFKNSSSEVVLSRFSENILDNTIIRQIRRFLGKRGNSSYVGSRGERIAEKTSEEVLKKGKKKGTVSRRELLKMSFIVRHRQLSVSIFGLKIELWDNRKEGFMDFYFSTAREIKTYSRYCIIYKTLIKTLS